MQRDLAGLDRRLLLAAGASVLIPPGPALSRGMHGGAPYPRTASFYNFLGSNLRKYRTAVSAARNAVILCDGDSTTAGQGATNNAQASNAKSQSYPTQLAGLLSGASWSSFNGNNNVGGSLPAFDSRISLTNWVADGNTVEGGPTLRCDSPNTDSLSFTPTNSVDTFDVYALQSTGTGSFTLDIGGSVLATTNTNGSAAVVKTTITVALGAHTLNIKRSAGGSVYIVGVVAYNSAVKETTILNGGWIGGKASDLIGTASAWSAGNLSGITPDLSNLMIGINDWIAGVSVSTFASQVQTRITQLLGAGGDVIVMSPAPSQVGTGPSIATQQLYVDALHNAALNARLPFIDVFTLFGGDWTVSNGRGWMYDVVHPNGTGYAQIAGYLNTALAANFLSY